MKRAWVGLIILFGGVLIYGQEMPVTNAAGAEIIRDEERGLNKTGNSFTLSNERSRISRISDSVSKEGKILLTPAKEDYAKYEDFLKQSKTGIAKIFSDIECNKFLVNVNDQACFQAAQMAGQGAYYSFRKKNNNDSTSFDIYFLGGDFSIVNSTDSLGVWINLGETPIESTDTNSAQIVNLKNYQLPKTVADLLNEKNKLRDGLRSGNGVLAFKVKAKLNTTYGLRLVYWKDEYFGGDNMDALIVLRVIRENEDGSVTFVWRELQRKGVSKLIKSEN